MRLSYPECPAVCRAIAGDDHVAGSSPAGSVHSGTAFARATLLAGSRASSFSSRKSGSDMDNGTCDLCFERWVG